MRANRARFSLHLARDPDRLINVVQDLGPYRRQGPWRSLAGCLLTRPDACLGSETEVKSSFLKWASGAAPPGKPCVQRCAIASDQRSGLACSGIPNSDVNQLLPSALILLSTNMALALALATTRTLTLRLMQSILRSPKANATRKFSGPTQSTNAPN